MTPTNSTCPDCGHELDSSTLEGLCPKCLAAVAMGVTDEWAADSEASAEPTGTTIGKYRLLEKIGEGGFGIVYMAEQREPVTRKVALKIIKLGMDTRQVIARFEAERQALAMMDHPNIATVLDAGATHSGRPYFVMELVRGCPITEFCARNKLSMRRRLDLFVDVCAAVQHAHQKGIIHRDLKPSNVLVTMNDDHPIVKVIDFGIAKATAQKLTDQTLFTRFHQFIGTPAYMSPEQAQMNATDVDTRSDIYALGVLLYELLTGRPPFDAEALLKAGQEAVFRHVREVDPPRPSNRVSSMSREERDATALLLPEAPEKLSRLLRGDLDRVVMKSLEKDRRRRYETANALAQDVRRFVAHEPVSAVAPSTLYRLRKFVVRNRLATGAATAILLSLLLGLGFALYFYDRERAALGVAQSEKTEADEQRLRAEINEERAHRLQYAADMRLAQIALEESDYGLAQVILSAHIPSQERADLRGWEWRFLASQLRDDSLVSRRNSPASITSLSSSPDGSLLAVGHNRGHVEIIDALSLERLRTLQSEQPHGSRVAFLPGRDLLATTDSSDSKQEIQLWDTHSWEVRESIALPSGDGAIWAFAGSPDGRWLAAFARRGVLRVVSLETRETRELRGFDSQAGALAFSPDGRRLAAGPRAGRVVVFDLEDSAREALEIESARLGALEFSPGDGAILAGNAGPLVRLWDSRTGELIRELEGHVRSAGALAFIEDGRTLASASSDQTIRVWDVESGRAIAVLKGSQDELWHVTALADGRHLVSASKDGTLARWHPAASTSTWTRTLPGIRNVVSLSGPGGKMIVRSADGSMALVDWERSGRVEEIEPLHGPFQWARWCREKRILVLLERGADRFTVWSENGEVVHGGYVEPFTLLGVSTFIDDGNLLVSFDRHRRPVAWSTDTWNRADDEIGAWRAIFDDYETDAVECGGVKRFDVSPDQRRVALLTTKGCVVWYDLHDGSRLLGERCHREFGYSFTFAEHANLAASSSTGARVVLWQSDPPRILDRIRAGGQVAALSPDGSRLLTANHIGKPGSTPRLKIWDVRTRRHLLSIGTDAEYGHFYEIGFLPDGKGIFAATEDALHLWKAPELGDIELPRVSGSPESRPDASSESDRKDLEPPIRPRATTR